MVDHIENIYENIQMWKCGEAASVISYQVYRRGLESIPVVTGWGAEAQTELVTSPP